MAQSSEEPKFSLRLVVDEEKNKVVFAEACRDFVDVIFSLLTLPMGNIIRLLEKNQGSQPIVVGCFTNLYRSVVNLAIDDFETEACKQMLMHPRSLWDVQCKRLKLNINPSEDVKFFRCPHFSSCKTCSNFSTSRCRCGKLMSEEIKVSEVKVVQNYANGVFTRGRSSFIITDDLEVAVRSTDLVLRKLKSIGCGDVSKLGERLVDVGFDDVLTLLQCIFSSNAPLTDTFLNKQSSHNVLKICETLSAYMERKINEAEAEAEEVISFSAIVRKHDMRDLYVECGDDFVDFLFTFLAVPLESVSEISGNSSTFGCIGNLFKSFKDLNATEVSTPKSVLPHYYRCQKQLLNIITDQPPLYYCYNILSSYTSVYRLTTNSNESPYSFPVALMDPKSHGSDQSIRGTDS